MLAHGVGVVVRGIVIEKFDVADQGGAREDRFKQIVAQQGLFGNASVEGPLKSINFVQTLARVNAFAEKILINVRSRRGIRIDSSVAGEDAGKQRPRSAFERDAHAWLQNRVAADDCLRLAIEARLVKRMNRGANQTARCVARQLRVGIQCDHVTNLCQQLGAGRGQKKTRHWVRRRPACLFLTIKALKNQPIKLAQLAPLAFPTDPFAFGLAPFTRPVKKMKPHRRAATVLPVEFLDTVLCAFENLSIARHR